MEEKEEFKNSVQIVQLTNYVQPEVKEVASRDYVTYGKKNEYFYYLIDRSRGSATNGAVIQSLCDIIFGAGVNSDDLNEMISEDDQKRVTLDLYSLGQAAIQVQYFGGRKSAKGTHLPVETLAPEKVDDKGHINAYYYARDWTKVQSKKDLTRIPVFGTSTEGIEVIYIKPYRAGSFYFSSVTFQGGLQWAELEEEIANYHINNIKNGLAPSLFLSMNNGIPKTEEKAKEIKKRIQDQYMGSTNAGKMVLIFNDDKDHSPDIEAIPLSRAADQYQFLSDESSRKILTSHRITSPLLVGLNTATGFSSNADEIMVGFTALEHFVARPFRMLLIDKGFDPLMEFNNKTEDLQFETINPFLVEVQEQAEEVIEETEEATEELSKDKWEFMPNAADELIELGNDINLDEWELIDERDVDYENEIYLDQEIDELNDVEQTILEKIWTFVSTGRPRAGAKSSQDEKVNNNFYMVRYVYFPNKVGTGKTGESRAFCKAMVKADKLYRKEDIIKMDNSVVNAGWGLGGADKYSIWKYKGGGACHHRWRRKTFVAKKKTNVRGKDAKPIGTRAAEIRGYTVTNPWQVSVRPIDMPNKGFVNK